MKLTPRMVERLSLSADLLDVVEEWGRVGGKRGSGSAKKGKARLEGLLAQCVPRPRVTTTSGLVADGTTCAAFPDPPCVLSPRSAAPCVSVNYTR